MSLAATGSRRLSTFRIAGLLGGREDTDTVANREERSLFSAVAFRAMADALGAARSLSLLNKVSPPKEIKQWSMEKDCDVHVERTPVWLVSNEERVGHLHR